MAINLNLNKIPDFIEPKKTILEIGGYSHHENIISNYLQYYLIPDNDHNFGDFLFKILHEFLFDDDDYSSPENISCYREVFTNNRNRIDLLVVTEDVVIAIENKILHKPVNPFNDYKEYIESNYPQKKCIGLLLSLGNQEFKNDFFKEISYDDLIHATKKWYKDQFGMITNLKDLFFLDLLRSIENLMNNQPLPPEILNYISENRAGIIELKKALKSYYDVISNKVVILSEILDSHEYFQSKSIWKQNWIKDKLENLVHLKIGDKIKGIDGLEVKIRISPVNWSFELWETDRIEDKVRAFIRKETGNNFERTQEKKVKEYIIVKTYPFNNDINEVAEFVNSFFERVKTVANRVG